MLKLRKNKKGFTLVELIVVVAIMAVLAGTVAGVVVSTQNKTKNSAADSSAKNIAKQVAELLNVDYQNATEEYVKVVPSTTAGGDPTITILEAVVTAIKEANDTGAIGATAEKAGKNQYKVAIDTTKKDFILVTYTPLGSAAKETGYKIAYNKTSDSFVATEYKAS